MTGFKPLFYFIVTTVIAVLYYKHASKPNVEVPLVKAPVGDLVGIAQYTRKGRILHAYKGIPFVQPPVGKLRFRRPVPFEGKAWKGTFQAVNEVKKCVQKDPFFYKVTGVEDCLQLNVYVPRTENESGFMSWFRGPKKLPVMVYFYGGAYLLGDASEELFGPGILLDKDVILVVPNYRLNFFGFLTLGTEEVAGNQALWDQHEALKWVNKNIEAFGGDPQQVTIFGESAGGWSVNYQLASHKNKGLFQAAIIQSGPLEISDMQAEDHLDLVELHKGMAENIGCTTLECLQEKPTDVILDQLFYFEMCSMSELAPNPITTVPIDDSKISNDPFFHKNPRQILADGEFNVVPILSGEVKQEGRIYLSEFVNHPKLVQKFNDNWHQCMAGRMLARFYVDGQVPEEIIEKIDTITEYYLGDKNERFNPDPNDWRFKNFSQLITDGAMHYAGELQALQFSKKTTVYHYQYDYVGTFSYLDLAGKKVWQMIWTLIGKKLGLITARVPEPSHGDDLFVLWANLLNGKADDDQAMMDFMVDLWTNFATYHNPTPQDNLWPAYGVEGTTYVVLNNAQISLKTDPDRATRQKLWKQIYAK